MAVARSCSRASVVWPAVSAFLVPAVAWPCPPRAELGGDAEAVASVAAELKQLGVETGSGSRECPAIIAAVERDRGGGIAVAVQDASHRSEGRVVSDAALAAAWIDSWLRDDFTAPPEPVATHEPPPETPSAFEQFAVSAAFTQAWSDDSTWWTGAGVAGCGRVGGLCIGARASYAMQDIAVNATAAARRDMSLLATASYPIAVGRMSIAPELALGVGRLTTSRIDGCKTDPNCDPNDPMCVMPMPTCSDPGKVYVGDGLSAEQYTPRASLALRLAVPLFDHVWLDGLAAVAFAPFGHSDPYGGTVMDDPLALPGNPLFGVQLGIGLRVGAP